MVFSQQLLLPPTSFRHFSRFSLEDLTCGLSTRGASTWLLGEAVAASPSGRMNGHRGNIPRSFPRFALFRLPHFDSLRPWLAPWLSLFRSWLPNLVSPRSRRSPARHRFLANLS